MKNANWQKNNSQTKKAEILSHFAPPFAQSVKSRRFLSRAELSHLNAVDDGDSALGEEIVLVLRGGLNALSNLSE